MAALYPQDFYTLIEIQVSNGVKSVVPPIIYDDLNTGLTAYHQAATFASQSTIDYHGVILLNSSGRSERSEIFDRRLKNSQNVEPEPEVE